MSNATINVSGGGSVDSIELTIEDFHPTEGDCILAAQTQRSRLLRRTESGVDYAGRQFAGYNKTRPFYYYPNGPVGKERSKVELTRSKAGVKRFARKVGRTKGAVTRSGLGLRFDSYDSFKRTYLGREGVDLRGPRAPHMLQRMICRAGGLESGERNIETTSTAPGSEFAIGIYDNEASARAAGINSESRPKGMPRRQFLGSTEEDNRYLTDLIAGRARVRAIKKLSGKS